MRPQCSSAPDPLVQCGKSSLVLQLSATIPWLPVGASGYGGSPVGRAGIIAPTPAHVGLLSPGSFCKATSSINLSEFL